jgi:hypothetical protein
VLALDKGSHPVPTIDMRVDYHRLAKQTPIARRYGPAWSLRKCIADPKTQESFAAMYVGPTPRPGCEFAALMKFDFAKWCAVVHRAKIYVE